MNVNNVIVLARRHIGNGTMESSARLCLADAVAKFDNGDFDAAKRRALDSLRFSVGVFHKDFERASK